MRIISWNVQGLGGHLHKKMKGRFRQEIQPCLVGGLIDVIMLEEQIHLNNQRIKEFGPPFRGNWECYWSSSFRPHVVEGGNCIVINGTIKPYIVEDKILIEEQGQYIILHMEGK